MKAPPKQYLRLAEARRQAEEVVAHLSPLCERIEIAGSIRRERATCGDIDLVVLPKPCAPKVAWKVLGERMMEIAQPISGGPQILSMVLPTGFGIQIFIARPELRDMFGNIMQRWNWGTLLLCRTGSREHNIHIANVAKAKGLKWSPHEGLQLPEGNWIYTPEERDLLMDLGLGWIAPRDRERGVS